jgi:hypothetical protein
MSSRQAVRLVMLSTMALAILLFGQASFSGGTDGASDSLLVAGVAATGSAVNGAVADPRAQLPRGILETPPFPVGQRVATTQPRPLLPTPLSVSRNLPTDGEYAFTWTRLRTLSPLCRIACG